MTTLQWWNTVAALNQKNTESACTTTEKETRFEDRGGGHTLKTDKKKSRKKKITISCRAMINRTETGLHHLVCGAIQVFITWGVPV